METVAELPSLGGSIAYSFLSLGLVCLLAWVTLRWLARRGPGQSGGPLRVVARCLLEPRRSVYVVEAGGRFFLVGVGDGPMALLAELDAEVISKQAVSSAGAEPVGGRFPDALAKVLARAGAKPKS